MGCIQSFTGEHTLSFLEEKKITTLKPTYLLLNKNRNKNGWNYENIQKSQLINQSYFDFFNKI